MKEHQGSPFKTSPSKIIFIG